MIEEETPSVGSNGDQKVDWEHIVQFYETDDFLFDSVADFLSEGLTVSEPLVLLTTESHRDGIARRLASRGLDWDSARRSRQLQWVSARAALETVMIGRTPDPQRFRDQIGGLIRDAVERAAPGRVRAYGELVDLVWREGDADAALMIEDLWNELAETATLTLLCAYGKGNIYQESRGRRHREVCDRHSHVLPAENGGALQKPRLD